MPPPGSTKSAREHAFAHELELTRREAGLTVAQLAAALDFVPRTARRYLNAERRPTRGTVVAWEGVCRTQAGRLTGLYDHLDVPDSDDAARAPDTSTGARIRRRRRRMLFNLPAVVASFTGREDLLVHLDAALGPAAGVVTQAIVGSAGVGKTQLAAYYAQSRAGRYDVVAWIRAEDGGTADLANMAERIGIQVAGLSPSDRARAALERLASSEGHWSWLLVLDNVQSPKHLGQLLPRAGAGHVLVTSRDRALGQLAPVLTVEVFDEDTATRYLTDRTGRRGDADGARRLAHALGCLPLALSHAGAYCETGTSFATYLGLLERLPARELFDTNPEVSYSLTVASTWKASMTAATAHAALAGDVLEMAACLASDAIPKTLFGGLVADTAGGQKVLADAFNAIARFSLATIDDETLSLHRLLQKTIRDETASQAASRVLRVLRDAFPDDARTPATWADAERLLPHCVALAGQLSDPGGGAAELVELLNRVSWYLNNAEPGSRRSVAIARQNVSVAERLLDSDRPERLMAHNHLATALQWAGVMDEAVLNFESVLAERTRVLGAEHEHTLISSSNLALAYEDAGLSTKAIEIYERLLPIQERILGAGHAQCSFTRHNLAVSYKAGGRVGDAIAMLEPLLAARESTLGDENPETLKTRHHVAAAYRSAGQADRAIAILEPLLQLREQIVGAEHPHTLMTRHELGRAYGDAGRTAAALGVLRELVPVCDALLGAQHPDALAVRHSLGVAYAQAGQVDPAMVVLAAVLTDRERGLGRGHRDTGATRDALASLGRRPSPLR